MRTKVVIGIASWSYEKTGIVYDVLLWYRAEPGCPRTWDYPGDDPTCEIHDIKVVRVVESADGGQTGLLRSPTEEEKTRIAAEILDWCERSKAKRDELCEVCFEDANRRGER